MRADASAGAQTIEENRIGFSEPSLFLVHFERMMAVARGKNGSRKIWNLSQEVMLTPVGYYSAIIIRASPITHFTESYFGRVFTRQ
jgi:hypothetical protein